MASSPTPVPPQAAGGAQPGAPQSGGGSLAIFAQLTEAAKQMGQQFPATMPIVGQITDLIRQGLRTVLQSQQGATQAPPQI